MRRHVLKSIRCQCLRDAISPAVALRLKQFYVEVSRHQNSGASGPLLERGNDNLYRQGVVRGEVTSHNVPTPLPCCYMEADDVGPEMLDSIHRKIRCRPVKHCHSATVTAQRVHRNGTVPRQPVGLDSVSELVLLKDAQVHVGLGHPPQIRLQSPVSSVLNVIGDEPIWHPPPRIIYVTPTHPPPMDAF